MPSTKPPTRAIRSTVSDPRDLLEAMLLHPLVGGLVGDVRKVHAGPSVVAGLWTCHYLSAFAKPLNSANTCSTVAGGSSFPPPCQKSDGLNFAPPCFFSPAATAAM